MVFISSGQVMLSVELLVLLGPSEVMDRPTASMFTMNCITLKALFIILACICANVIYRELDCEVQISNTLSQRRFTPHSRVSNLNDF